MFEFVHFIAQIIFWIGLFRLIKWMFSKEN